MIKTLLDPEKGFVYDWLKKRDEEVETEKPLIEVYRVLCLCTLNHDLKKLDDNHKNMLIDFYWKMIKLRYNFKQWHLYAVSEFFKNVGIQEEKVNEVYFNILESNINENGRGKMLQSISVDNIIELININDISTMKNAVKYLRQDDNTMFHIADILIKYEEKFFDEAPKLYNEIRSIILKLPSGSYSTSYEKKKLVLYLCEM